MGKQEAFSSDESAPHTWYLHPRERALFYSQTAPVMKGGEGTETPGKETVQSAVAPKAKEFLPCASFPWTIRRG